MKTPLSIYIHIPFCRAKCLYCDFLSDVGGDAASYVEALCAHITSAAADLKGYEVVTVFFGGGTPTVLAAAQLLRILGVIRRNFSFSPDANISTEANPETVDLEYLQGLRQGGFNRISFGVQSFNDKLLKHIGRLHSGEGAVEAVRLAAAAGFEDINIDLMFALPHQSVADFDKCLDMAMALPISHISCYALTVEEGTPLAARHDLQAAICDEETDRAMYHLAAAKLAQGGFGHYEISNWAKPGRECRHNLGYWTGREYAGFGAGAHSLLKNRRLANAGDVGFYAKSDFAPILLEQLSLETAMTEFVILGLRLLSGICPQEFRRRFGRDLFDTYGPQIARLKWQGLLEINTTISLTKKGLDLSNVVFADFV